MSLLTIFKEHWPDSPLEEREQGGRDMTKGNIVILRGGLTAEGDMRRNDPVVLIRGVDDLGKPIFLRLDIDQMNSAGEVLKREKVLT